MKSSTGNQESPARDSPAETGVNRARRRLATLLVIAFSSCAIAMTFQGAGTITPAEQQVVDYYVGYFGRASLFTREYCYFDEEGKAKNRGSCFTEMPRMPSLSAQGRGSLGRMQEEEYARQYYGTPLGKPTANPEMEIIYLHTIADIWVACSNRRAFGCTLTEEWPRKVTIFVPTFDRTLGNRILNHEIEYHAKRNIEH